MPAIELFHFQGSHFNEKARWALDLKHVPHTRTALLPGPHMPRMQKLSGQTSTPVLTVGDEVIPGSTRIIERLERDFPEPALYPEDAGERARAVALVREFDEEVGPAVRLAKFFETMDAKSAVGIFGKGRGPVVKALYGAGFPILWRVMQNKMQISEPAARRDRERTLKAFDFVAEESTGSGYLVGERFSIADLTCAALLMPAVSVSEWGGPEDVATPKAQAWLARWSEHPGAEWVREIYRRHRRT